VVRSLSWNPIPKAAHIVIERPQNSNDDEVVLVAELRCGKDTVSDNEGFSYEFGFNKLFVELLPIDCEIKPGRRVGDVDKRHVYKRKDKTTRATSRTKKVGASGGLRVSVPPIADALRPSVGGSISADLRATQLSTDGIQSEELIETIFHPVISNGQNELLVQAPPHIVLQGPYLSQDDLCTIMPKSGSFYSLDVAVYFRPLSLEITAAASETRHWLRKDLSSNKLAFAKLLLAKYLQEFNKENARNDLSRILVAAARHDGPTPAGGKQ